MISILFLLDFFLKNEQYFVQCPVDIDILEGFVKYNCLKLVHSSLVK